MSGHDHGGRPDSAESAGLNDAEVLDIFREFPAPLLLLDREDHTARGNERYLKAFRIDGLPETQMAEWSRTANDNWQEITLTDCAGLKARVRARALLTSRHVLLIMGDDDRGGLVGELDQLRIRIGSLEREASTDHLTGAWNRAHLDRVIGPEIARSQSAKQPLSLILIDIDHFKDINDTHGHAVGDLVLKDLVLQLRAHVRTADLVFRWGGEEFVVLLSNLGYRRAAVVAEALRSAVADHSFETVGRLTISLGVAEQDGEEDPAAWFRRVDDALYQAKNGGRNRVVVANRGNSDIWAAGGIAALHLIWHESFESGNPEIDAEHHELFRLSNVLIESMMRNSEAPGAASAPLENLLAHIKAHFAHEESILEQLNYIGLPEHRRSHEGLIKRALKLADEVNAGQAGIGAVVEFIARDVVLRHLVMVDQAFFPLLTRQGEIAPQTSARMSNDSIHGNQK